MINQEHLVCNKNTNTQKRLGRFALQISIIYKKRECFENSTNFIRSYFF